MDEMKQPLKNFTLEQFIAKVKEVKESVFDEETKKLITEKSIKTVCETIYNNSIYNKNSLNMAINRAKRDLKKSIILADSIIEGYYLGGIDAFNPKKEKEPTRQTIVLYDEKENELKEVTVFGHGLLEVVDGIKTSEKGSFIFGQKYRIYGKPFEAFKTVTGTYMEKMEGQLDTKKFFKNYLEPKALEIEEIDKNNLWKLIVIKSKIKFIANLEIIGEDKTAEMKPVLNRDGTIATDEYGNPKMSYPITAIGEYPIVTNRLDDKPSLPCFAARIKLDRDESLGEEDERNYGELVFYPQKLGQTRVSLIGLREVVLEDKMLELLPHKQVEIVADLTLDRDIYAIGRVSQFNREKERPINWIKINTILMTDNEEIEDSLKDVTLEVFDDEEVTVNESVAPKDKSLKTKDLKNLVDLKALLNSATVKMLGATNYQELKKAGRLSSLSWINDSYESIINELLEEEGRLSL